MNRKIKNRFIIAMFALSFFIAIVFVLGYKSATKSCETSESATEKKQIEEPKPTETPKNYVKDIFEIDQKIAAETDPKKLSELQNHRIELLEYQKIFQDFMLDKELHRSE